MKWRQFKRTYPFVCTKCGEISNMERVYCEKCGEKDSLRPVNKQDYENFHKKK